MYGALIGYLFIGSKDCLKHMSFRFFFFVLNISNALLTGTYIFTPSFAEISPKLTSSFKINITTTASGIICPIVNP